MRLACWQVANMTAMLQAGGSLSQQGWRRRAIRHMENRAGRMRRLVVAAVSMVEGTPFASLPEKGYVEEGRRPSAEPEIEVAP